MKIFIGTEAAERLALVMQLVHLDQTTITHDAQAAGVKEIDMPEEAYQALLEYSDDIEEAIMGAPVINPPDPEPELIPPLVLETERRVNDIVHIFLGPNVTRARIGMIGMDGGGLLYSTTYGLPTGQVIDRFVREGDFVPEDQVPPDPKAH